MPLNKPLFLTALLALLLTLGLELGARWLVRVDQAAAGLDQLTASLPGLPPGTDPARLTGQARQQQLDQGRPPGLGISYLVLLDGLFLFALASIASAMVIPKDWHARISSLATLIVGLLLILGAFLMAMAAYLLLLLMVSLLLAVPFGTIAYLVVWGSFETGRAALVLGLLVTLKLVIGGSLLLANPGFAKNKGLVLLFFTAFLGAVLTAFLHGLVPGFLVSITDALAALITAVLALVWAVIYLIGALPGLVRMLRVDKLAG